MFASALPNSFAVIVRLMKAGTNAFMIRFIRPGMIRERFSRNAFSASATHCSAPIGFIGMVCTRALVFAFAGAFLVCKPSVGNWGR